MWNKDGAKHKKIGIDRKGLLFRLYIIFVVFALTIVVVIGITQLVTTQKQARVQTKQQLQRTARNISSTYGTDAYEKAIRSVLYSRDYIVRTMTEDGIILIDTDEISWYIRWPEIAFELEDILEMLDHSDGYIYLEERDSENKEWIVYGQVVASWDGTRELLFIATDTSLEQAAIRSTMLRFLFIAGIVGVLSFVICWFIAKIYLKPIHDITDRAEALSKGDYSVQFPKESYTEMNTLSDTLERAVEQLADYEQIRRDMIANLSHDMRTPLTMIKAYAEMIQTISGDNPEKRNAHLDVIISQADKLSAFVSGSLDLGRLQSKTVQLEYRRFPLDRFVDSHMKGLIEVDGGQHEFVLNLEPDCYIRADIERIGQIVTNLVNNSMKYGGDRIDVNVKRNKDVVRMEIIDYGEGIPEEKLHHVWTKYYRVNPYGKDSGSAGLGLSIVKEIADLHGLNYGTESLPEYGAYFWFEFPYCEQ